MTHRTVGFLALLLGSILAAGCDDPVRVSADPAVAVEIVTTDSILTLSRTLQLEALATTASGEPAEGTAVWRSSMPGVATVSDAGLVTGLAVGATVVSATVDGVEAEWPVRVTRVAALGEIEVAEGEPLRAGGTYEITALAADVDGAAIGSEELEYTWSVAPSSRGAFEGTPTGAVARLAGLEAGEVEVTVSVDGFSRSRTLEILPGDRTRILGSIGVPGGAEGVAVGGSRPLSGDIIDPDLHDLPLRPVAWSSSDPDVVAVDADGVIRGIAAGEAFVRAKAEGALPDSVRVVATRGFTSRELDFEAHRLNESGQVVGFDDGAGRAILWSEGVETVVNPSERWLTAELRLNDRGQLAGSYVPAASAPGAPGRAFFWDGGAAVELPLPEGYVGFWITGLDDEGAVYGSWIESTSPLRLASFRWKNGEYTLLPEFEGGAVELKAVNRHGHVLGISTRQTTLLLRDGGWSEVAQGFGQALNDHGDFVVESNGVTTVYHRDGTETRYGPSRHTGHSFVAINAAGELVGTYRSGPEPHRALWRDGVALNPMTLTVDRNDLAVGPLVDLNDRGEILVNGERSLLLTPR